MAKSFKKVLASLLAVLMAVFSMPFSAFANAGEYKVDVTLLFSPVYIGEYFDYAETSSADSNYFEYTMLQEAPLTYDYTWSEDYLTIQGTLTLESKKTEPICNSLGVEPLAKDTELGVGDYFAVTVAMTGTTKMCAQQTWFTYSENLEPAGMYTRKSGRTTYYGLAGYSDQYFDSVTLGGLKPVDSMSAAGLVEGIDDGALGNIADIAVEKEGTRGERIMKSNNACQNGGDYADTFVDLPDGVSLTNPYTGELDYDYAENGLLPTNTFIFKIVDEGDVAFTIYDPDNTRETSYGAFFYCDDGGDISNENYNTYAVNYGTLGKQYPNKQKGSYMETFYGINVNTGEGIPDDTACEHTNWHYENQKDATCTEDGYTGDKVCDDCKETFEQGSTITKTDHSYTSSVTTEATCEKAGVTTWTCSGCGDTYTTDEPDAKGHNYQEVAGSATDSTCKVAGKEADKQCSNCGDVITGAAKELAEHTPGTPVKENEVAATEEAGGSYDLVTYCSVCNDKLSTQHVETDALEHVHSYTSVYTAPTCTTNGYTTYTCVKGDDTYVVYDDPDTTLGHDYQEVPGSAVKATCTTDGKEADKACSRCGDVITGATIPMSGHDYQEVAGSAVKATCTTDGKEADTKCANCGDVITGATIPMSGHDYQEVAGSAVNPTCTTDGKEADTKCANCGDVITGDTIPMSGHDYQEVAGSETDSTCTVAGKYADKKCANCGDTITGAAKELADHTPGTATKENEVAATKKDAGSYDMVTRCDVCGEVTSTEHFIVDALGVNVTIGNTYENYGDVDVTYGTHNYAYGETVSLVAEPVEGASFVGWQVNNKIIATDLAYDFVAYQDITVTPVFTVENAADEITVVFLDMYKNVTATYNNVTVADFQAEMAKAVPAGTEFPGYAFKGWSISDDEIKALDHSATINAVYEIRENDGYTITATGAEISANGASGTDSLAGVAYDTLATVTAEGATAWKMGNEIVEYGDTYSFYVGADITLVPVFEEVSYVVPAVAIVSADLSGTSDYKVAFLATTTVPAGYTLIDRGFVYGKAATSDELTLENVGNTIAASGAKVKAVSAGADSESNQYCLIYGITAKDANAVAVAYITVEDSEGEIVTIYSDGSVFAY